jgi:hypothetical protein
VCPAIAG